MKRNLFTLKDKVFLFLFLIGWGTIAFAALQILGRINHDRIVQVMKSIVIYS